jgi:tetratricopeptide (TPR) repeat protein
MKDLTFIAWDLISLGIIPRSLLRLGFFGWPRQTSCPGHPMPRTLSGGYLPLFVVAMTALFLVGRAPAQTLDDANRAFAASKFHDATVACQAVLAQNGYSAPVLFDLGNSAYREGNFAQAILAYRRAQWLAPNDPDIAANLAQAQKQAGLPVTERRRSDAIIHAFSASGWAWIACAAWTLLCASLLARAVVPPRRSLFSFTAIASAFVLTTAIAGAVFASDALRQAIVVDKNASALISPFPAAQAVFSPAPGETVTIQKAYDDFLLVTDRAGHSGWINKNQIAPIVSS